MLLACPVCAGSLEPGAKLACPSCGIAYQRKDGIPVLLPPALADEQAFNQNSWDTEWRKASEHLDEYLEHARRVNAAIADQVLAVCGPRTIYCEIGCGIPWLGLEVARRGATVIGVDFSPLALRIASTMFLNEGLNGLFILGDLNRLPVSTASCDVIYGGGVIEHLHSTQQVVDQLHRILRPGGIAFNTVPYLAIGSLTYRQVWGNIPDAPILRPLAEWLHMRLLGGRHMRFGYEKSFTRGKLRRLFKDFTSVKIDRAAVDTQLEYLPFEWLRRPARRLARRRLFWPMVMIQAQK